MDAESHGARNMKRKKQSKAIARRQPAANPTTDGMQSMGEIIGAFLGVAPRPIARPVPPADGNFWRCEPCKVVLTNDDYRQPYQAYCPMCREPMEYHGTAERRPPRQKPVMPVTIDATCEDVTRRRIEAKPTDTD